jgi:hypothetical protein
MTPDPGTFRSDEVSRTFPYVFQPSRDSCHQTNVELNRYAVGAGEWVGVSPRLVSCECDPLAGSGCID